MNQAEELKDPRMTRLHSHPNTRKRTSSSSEEEPRCMRSLQEIYEVTQNQDNLTLFSLLLIVN